jgi:phosphoribosylanthranilate isomerase
MLVKVCGMKYEANISELSKTDIDFMGFIFYEKSVRYTENIPVSVPEHIQKVGVFVNKDISELKEIANTNQLDYIQLHGDEDAEYCKNVKNAGLKLIKVFRIDESFDFNQCKPYSELAEMFLFDKKVKKYGGSGKKFDWDLLHKYREKVPFLLSGGISPEDHTLIKDMEHEYLTGVDLNSNFEKEPALKDVDMIKTFIKNLKSNELF